MFKPGMKPGASAPAEVAPKKPAVAKGPKKPFSAEAQLAKAKALRNIVPKGPKELEPEGAAKTVD